MRNQTFIASVENLESVLEILKVLIREGIQQAQGYPGGPIQRRAQETEETIEEQGWLARIVHLIRGKDNDTQFKVSKINVQPRCTLTALSAPPSCAQVFCRRQRACQIHIPGHYHSITQARTSIQEARTLRRQLAIAVISSLQVHAQHPIDAVHPRYRLRRSLAPPLHRLRSSSRSKRFRGGCVRVLRASIYNI